MVDTLETLPCTVILASLHVKMCSRYLWMSIPNFIPSLRRPREVLPSPHSLGWETQSLCDRCQRVRWATCRRKSQKFSLLCLSFSLPTALSLLSPFLFPRPLLSQQVATSIKSLLRPRVAFRTSPGDVVCLQAYVLDGVSVCLCIELLTRWKGGGGQHRVEKRKHMPTDLVIWILVWTQLFPLCQIKRKFSHTNLLIYTGKNKIVDYIGMPFTCRSVLKSLIQLDWWAE